MNFAFLETSAAGGSMWTSIIMMALIILVFWFFIIRPQRKKDKETAKMRSELQVGDEIVTIGGIIGIIVRFPCDRDRQRPFQGSSRPLGHQRQEHHRRAEVISSKIMPPIIGLNSNPDGRRFYAQKQVLALFLVLLGQPAETVRIKRSMRSALSRFI